MRLENGVRERIDAQAWESPDMECVREFRNPEFRKGIIQNENTVRNSPHSPVRSTSETGADGVAGHGRAWRTTDGTDSLR